MSKARVTASTIFLALLLPLAPALAQETYYQALGNATTQAQPPLPSQSTYAAQYVLDDNVEDGAFGVTSGLGAGQFLWFNRFTNTYGAFTQLREAWVLFPSGPNMVPGAAVQLVVYIDNDANPANGATLVSSFNTTIQFADDATFSIYPLPQPVPVPAGSDLLVGVIPRFIVSGVTSPTNPAAVDSTASNGRSWVAVWNGDPPASPVLPPNALIARLDDLQAGGGNWMIRAFGVGQPPPTQSVIPATGAWALGWVAAMILLAAIVAMRRSDFR